MDIAATRKIAQDTALAIARISVGLASLSAGVFAVLDMPGSTTLELGVIKSILPWFGIILVYSAALNIDWIIDRFDDDEWKWMRENVENSQKFDQILGRICLFNSGYLLLTICISALNTVLSIQVLFLLHMPNNSFKTIGTVLVSFSGVYIFFRMMTKNSNRIRYLLISLIIGILITLIVLR